MDKEFATGGLRSPESLCFAPIQNVGQFTGTSREGSKMENKTIQTKACRLCKQEKSIDSFYKDKSKPDGHKPRCKDCERLYKNITKRREYEKEYRKSHPEKRSKILAAWYAKNKKNYSLTLKKYRETDQFQITHKQHMATRRARMASAYIEYVDYEALYEKHKYCFYCKKELPSIKDVEFDHYIPLSKGGKHETSNIRVSCLSCNRIKGAKIALV